MEVSAIVCPTSRHHAKRFWALSILISWCQVCPASLVQLQTKVMQVAAERTAYRDICGCCIQVDRHSEMFDFWLVPQTAWLGRNPASSSLNEAERQVALHRDGAWCSYPDKVIGHPDLGIYTNLYYVQWWIQWCECIEMIWNVEIFLVLPSIMYILSTAIFLRGRPTLPDRLVGSKGVKSCSMTPNC